MATLSETSVNAKRDNPLPRIRITSSTEGPHDGESTETLKNSSNSAFVAMEEAILSQSGHTQNDTNQNGVAQNGAENDHILRDIHRMCSDNSRLLHNMQERITQVEAKADKNRHIIQKTHEELLKENATIYRRLNTAEDEIKVLKSSTPRSSPTTDPGRLQTLIMDGLDKKDQTEKAINKIFKDIGVTLTGRFQIKALQNGKTAIQFSTFWDRNAVYKGRIKLVQHHEGVFINECLTEEEAKLFFLARSAKKQKLINSTWTRNGACFISKIVNGESQTAEVKDEATLLKLLPKFIMPAPKGKKDKPANKKAVWSEEEHQQNTSTPRRNSKEEEEGQLTESSESESDSDDTTPDETSSGANSNNFLASKERRATRLRAASPNASQDHSATPGPSGVSETLAKKNGKKGIKTDKVAGKRRPNRQ